MFRSGRFLDVTTQSTGVSVSVLRLEESGITLGRVLSGGHEIMLEDPDHVTVLLPTQGRIAIRVGQREHGFANGRPILVQAEARQTRVIPPNGGIFSATTLQIPRGRLARLFSEGAGKPPALVGDAGSIHTAFGRELANLLPLLADDVFRQPDRLLPARALAELVDLLDDLLIDHVDGNGIGRRSWSGLREFQRISRACDIMQARGEDPLSIADLASELGVTPRSLQLSFRAMHGVSPRQYLENLRLDRARARILSQGDSDSITEAALESGLSHLGRFAQAYRRRFGELPSETQARQRGRTVAPAQRRSASGS